jgi:hypothetical protein
MPFLRFTRDTRGYETTSVVHTFRRRGKSRSRILYLFHTPANIKVGRGALDEEAIRTIEESNPDLPFDWAKMLKLRAAAAAQPAERERGRRRSATPRAPQERRKRSAPEGKRRARGEPDHVADPSVRAEEPRGLDEQIASVSTPEVPPERITSSVSDAEASGEAPERRHLAIGLIGAENVASLRAQHAEVLARVSDRVTDPARRQALQALAEELNPDAWLTAEEVQQGLADFDARLARLGAQLGRRRSGRGGRGRTRRRRAAAAPPTDSAGEAPTNVQEPDPEAGT